MTTQTNKHRTKAVHFFLFTFGWSLAFWFLTVALGGIDQTPGSILQYVGGAGPLIAALVITHFFEDRDNKKEFWNRTFNPQRIPWRWLLAAFLIHPAILFISVAVDSALGGLMQWKTANLTNFGAIANLVFFVFVFGPLPEEIGWRGVGYDRLVQKWNPLTASLILGVAWSAWHIPLFLIEGTFQHQLGFGSFRFWVFLASNIPLTVIITLVYNHTEISILSAAIVHFSGNIIGAILTKTDQLAFIELIGLTMAAIIITARYGMNLGANDNLIERSSELGG
jgi:membrane protease YdiL (CAAX protease family)